MDLSLRLSINGNRRQRQLPKHFICINICYFGFLFENVWSVLYLSKLERHITNLKEHCFF